MTEDNDNFFNYSDGLSFAGLLNNLLQEHGRSAAWLASRIGVERSTVSRWVDGGTGPRDADTITKIADAFQLEGQKRVSLFNKVGLRKIAIHQNSLKEQLAGSSENEAINLSKSETLESDGDAMYFPVGRTEEEQRQVASQIKRLSEQGVRRPVIFMLGSLVLLAVILFAYRSQVIQTLRAIGNLLARPTPVMVPIPYPTELVPTVIFTPTATLVPTLDFFGATPVAIPSAGINIRNGPGTEYEIVQTSQSGDRLVLIGKSPDGTWWNVEFNGISGWVLGELVAVQNSEGVPVVVNFPPPPATSTPEPVPVTATPQPPTEAPTPLPTETVSQQTTEPTLGTQALASFNKIMFSAPGNLLLVQEEASSITIDAPENVLSAIYARVEGSTLLIGTTSPIQIANASIQYRVSTPNVDTIVASSTGDIRANNLKADILNLTSGGTGAIDFGTLSARIVFVNIIGTGDIVISSGNAVEENVNIAGTGDFSAGNLKSDKAIIYIGGTGDATVWVNAQLEATITGTGTIRYFGSPAVSQNIAELGEIESLGPK